MIIRLTSPEAFDRLIEYLEAERGLVWPDLKGSKKSFRDYFIEMAKEKMATDTVLLHVDWKYDAQTNRLESEAYYTVLSEFETDEEYMEEELKKQNDEK